MTEQKLWCADMNISKTEQYSLACKVYNELKKKGKTLATAESCTGGLIGATITAVPGVSECYGFGVVTYANEAKEKLLGVSHHTLETVGAVSPETAKEMAEGALKLSDADVAVAVTGIAGPGGGSAEKPVGLVYIGIASREKEPKAIRNIFAGDRDEVRASTVKKALELVLEELQ